MNSEEHKDDVITVDAEIGSADVTVNSKSQHGMESPVEPSSESGPAPEDDKKKSKKPRKSKSNKLATKRTRRLEFPEGDYEEIEASLAELITQGMPLQMTSYLVALHRNFGPAFQTRMLRIFTDAMNPEAKP